MGEGCEYIMYYIHKSKFSISASTWKEVFMHQTSQIL